jgi:hypothetical protein
MGDGTGTVWRLTGTGRVDYAAPEVHWEIEGWREPDPPGLPRGEWYRFMDDDGTMPLRFGEAEAREYMAREAAP